MPLVLTALLSPFLFIGDPGRFPSRSTDALWDLGHVALFAFAVLALLRWRRPTQPLGLGAMVAILSLAVTLAIGIELLQGFVGRSQSAGDVLLSAAGAWFGLWAGSGFLRGHRAAVPAALVSIVIAAAAATPATLAFVDEAAARRSFPVLADFTSDRELSRWRLIGFDARVPASDGHNGALALTARAQGGSSFHLAYAPRDWSAFTALEIRLRLDGPGQPFVCRLNDLAHDLATPHENSDHYEEIFSLVPGWQTVSLELERAAAGLATRRMNLAEINGLTCFLRDAPSETTLLVDHVRLVTQAGTQGP